MLSLGKRRTSEQVRSDRSEAIRKEQERLDEPIDVFDIRDDKFLFTTNEASIPRSAKSDYWWRIAGVRPLNPDYVLMQRQKRHKCSYCRFKSIHPQSVDHHETFTHLPGHPTSIYRDQSDLDKRLWKIAHRRIGL